jgi:hypothetical protein
MKQKAIEHANLYRNSDLLARSMLYLGEFDGMSHPVPTLYDREV